MSAVCPHFGACGGCAAYQPDQDAYRRNKRERVAAALARQGLKPEVAELAAVQPGTRRRAVFKIAHRGDRVDTGFHALRSHTIVDMQACLVLTPALTALVPRLRGAMRELLAVGHHAEAHVTEADNGIDIVVRASVPLTAPRIAMLARHAAMLNAIRIAWNGTLAYETAVPVIRFGRAVVRLPPESFLQPTRQGETILRDRVLEIVARAKTVADLFSGCGTFSLPLAEQARVHAVEREQLALDALSAAARATPGLKPLTVERRDLFKLPLAVAELNRFDAVVLDPPRAGAEAQARQLAQSKVGRIAYVSCEAASFARDARRLVDGGYRLGTVLPVDQFLWSRHVEIVADFTRPRVR
jgi:23S rRNA (uracil1939-C5)-methyltransferase